MDNPGKVTLDWWFPMDDQICRLKRREWVSANWKDDSRWMILEPKSVRFQQHHSPEYSRSSSTWSSAIWPWQRLRPTTMGMMVVLDKQAWQSNHQTTWPQRSVVVEDDEVDGGRNDDEMIKMAKSKISKNPQRLETFWFSKTRFSIVFCQPYAITIKTSNCWSFQELRPSSEMLYPRCLRSCTMPSLLPNVRVWKQSALSTLSSWQLRFSSRKAPTKKKSFKPRWGFPRSSTSVLLSISLIALPHDLWNAGFGTRSESSYTKA